ncbi:alpha/beta hydrolase [Falsiroseomonas bella]|uniref:Alpha/beta hydrolase n=1 Tax=Falsiroseomonas bella TaxID=2184016 RepID=A0A317FM41_9PROT|nr:alpha/beta hydrolase [Falsiroseomonas bella]PWS38666.1 alpha/beta hydrolase [Falsiroseomonas bella]
MAVWRHYGQAELDAQFTLDAIRDLDALFARRAEAAARARATLPHRAGLRYGAHPAETLDFYPAATPGPWPLLLFIHGGFWRSLDASGFAFVAEGFVGQGVAVAVLDYPLIPDVRLGAIVESCRRAVGWLHAQAASLGCDPAAIFVSGNSAGGHLVAELMDRAWPPAHGLPDEVIAGGCAISGLFELEPVRRSAQNATLGFTEQEAASLSPARRVGRGAPLLVSVGGAEAEEFLRQSRDFAAAWNAAGNRAELVIPAGADHITVVLDAFAVPGSGLNAAMMRLIREAQPG